MAPPSTSSSKSRTRKTRPNGSFRAAAHSRANGASVRALSDQILLSRIQFMRQAGITYNGKRDSYEILGYQRELTTQDYHDRYHRGGIAGRIVDVFPRGTWRSDMWLEENDNPDTMTPFEQQWEDLAEKFDLQTIFQRVDVLSLLGPFAVLLIGAKGELDQELPKGKPGGLLYFTPFAGGGGPSMGREQQHRTLSTLDADAVINELETDTSSPRFGLPKSYQIKRLDAASPQFQKPVHWSRIIHVADGCLDNEVYGQPALERVWNLLNDLEKVTGGGAEAFWLRANQGLHLDVDKSMSLSDAEKEALREQADAYQHQIRRMMRTRGVTLNTLGSDVASFGPDADAILTQISGAKGIPKRILTGSEMGELASSQDRENWKDQIVGRQLGYAGPYIVKRLADRLIDYGYLIKPKSYEVKWSPIQTLTEDEKASGAQRWSAVNKTQGEIVFTNDEIRDQWYGKAPLTDEEKVPPQPPAMPGQQPGVQSIAKPPEPEIPRSLEDNGEDPLEVELVKVLEAAIVAGNTDVVTRLVGLGGPGSGNFGHAGRPGEVGGSAPAPLSKTEELLRKKYALPPHEIREGYIPPAERKDKFGRHKYGPKGEILRLPADPMAISDVPEVQNWLLANPQPKMTDEQLHRVHAALAVVDKILSDPELGGPVFSALSGFTPQGLRERLHEFYTRGVSDLALWHEWHPEKHPARGLPTQVKGNIKKMKAASETDMEFAKIGQALAKLSAEEAEVAIDAIVGYFTSIGLLKS